MSNNAITLYVGQYNMTKLGSEGQTLGVERKFFYPMWIGKRQNIFKKKYHDEVDNMSIPPCLML